MNFWMMDMTASKISFWKKRWNTKMNKNINIFEWNAEFKDHLLSQNIFNTIDIIIVIIK